MEKTEKMSNKKRLRSSSKEEKIIHKIQTFKYIINKHPNIKCNY